MLDNKAFYWWLVGMIDGEGHFGLIKSKHGSAWRGEFKIKLRDDDHEMVKKAQAITGLGKVYFLYQNRKNQHGQVAWVIHRREELAKLTEILDRHLLQSKKLKEYLYWRRAIMELQTPFRVRKNKVIASMDRKIKELRQYSKVSED